MGLERPRTRGKWTTHSGVAEKQNGDDCFIGHEGVMFVHSKREKPRAELRSALNTRKNSLDELQFRVLYMTIKVYCMSLNTLIACER